MSSERADSSASGAVRIVDQQLLEQLLDTVPALVVVLAPDGTVRRFNRGCEQVTGFTADEVVGRPIWDVLIPSEQVAQVRSTFAQLTAGSFPNSLENHWLCRDGGRRLIAWSNTALLDNHGGVSHVLGTGRDITDERNALAALQASEGRYRALVEGADDAIVIADGETGILVDANRRAAQLLGAPVEELAGNHLGQLYPPEYAVEYQQRFDALVARGRGRMADIYLQHADGTRIPVEVSVNVAEVDGRPLVQGIFHDVSERLRDQEQVRMLSSVVKASPNAIMIADLDGKIEYCNPRFYEITGYSAEEVLGRNPRFLKSDEHDPDFFEQLWTTLLRGEVWFGELRNRKKNGQHFWAFTSITPIYDEVGNITHFASISEDVSKLKFAESTIRHLAYFDPLTNLPNRSLFKDRLEQAVSAARTQHHAVALLFIDLDRFKTVNDTLGHQVGDELLVAVAERFDERLDEGITLARLGGDEFAVVVPSIDDVDHVIHYVEGIREALHAPFVVGDHELFVTASIGISVYPYDTGSVEVLISNADLAMFRAKDIGRSNYQFFTSDMNVSSFEQLSMEVSLRHALERDQFILYYQPKINLLTGRMTGVEALVRWAHPDLGLVSPAKFIPVAEETGLIVSLGAWVLREACRQVCQWHGMGAQSLRVSVNLSPRQFTFHELPEQVRSILQETGLPASCLELEITENALMHNSEQSTELLNTLKAMGIRLSIDDFGTGYSSLNYLKRFPIDTLKVDQSFARDVTTDSDDAAIARAIIALGHSMRLAVVAEGVETREQLGFFQSEHCDEVQGYYFSPPLPPEGLEALLDLQRDWLQHPLGD